MDDSVNIVVDEHLLDGLDVGHVTRYELHLTHKVGRNQLTKASRVFGRIEGHNGDSCCKEFADGP
jgi:hypothetical protein